MADRKHRSTKPGGFLSEYDQGALETRLKDLYDQSLVPSLRGYQKDIGPAIRAMLGERSVRNLHVWDANERMIFLAELLEKELDNLMDSAPDIYLEPGEID